ncbi:TetR/AcrR family transcriptional regulator [Streptomyces odontomachi]|uniref:TetR/AcrR family transcriptional regulator n=1 Tax=Streptomyces odontomachi TaxID=2944940 RepID=UPI00210E1E8D|nr:TetR/AcrR family transcriptional regulator [Streptomyces sp. ODS25]
MTRERGLRQDAVRNRERLVLAAREVFGRHGLDVPLDRIAREAGVAIGTLYNRFPTRGALVDAALGPLAERAAEITERATQADDAWDGFACFMEQTCELLAEDRGYADVYRSRVAGTPIIDAAQQRIVTHKSAIVQRAKAAGVLRTDIEPSDLALLSWGIAAVVDATRGIAPNAWRRHLSILLDGLRPEAAHPLRIPPLTPQQVQDAKP